MSEFTQTRREIIKEQAEAEKYAQIGEIPKRKPNWEQVEAEIQTNLNER